MTPASPLSPARATLARAAGLLAVSFLLAGAGSPAPVQLLEWPGAQRSDRIGSAYAGSDRFLAVGAERSDAGGTEKAGLVRFYELVGGSWQPRGVLSPPEAERQVEAHFGAALALDGGRLLVGAPGLYADQGGAYLYERSGERWTQAARFLVNAADRADFGGGSVAIDGDFALMGVPGHDGSAADAGKVQAYRREGGSWVADGELVPDQPIEGSFFGSSLVLAGNEAIVGGRTFDGPRPVYVFHRGADGWTQAGMIQAPDDAGQVTFGEQVASDGETLAVIGKLGGDGEEAGRALFLFERSDKGWRAAGRIAPEDTDRTFGASLSVLGDRVLIGQPRADADGRDAGAVYVVRRGPGGWTLEGRLENPAPAEYGEFGTVVAQAGDSAFVTNPWGTPDDSGEETGTILVYR
ncbi:MAG: hypothetical protein ACX93N_08790 [Pseudohaliea sp.]